MSTIRPRSGILDVAPYVPGNLDLLDPDKVIYLASNESPLGASTDAIEAYQNCATKLHLYPDASCKNLRAAIAGNYSLHPDQIVCGNGSERLIDFIATAYAGPGDEIVYSEYGFIMYPISTRVAGAKPVTAKEKNFTTDVDALLAAVTENTRVVFLANPNNPTGTYLPAAEVRRLRKQLPEQVLLVIDAAYADYVETEDYSAGHELVNDDTSNVVVLHTFSKIYGLASLRLGWAYCPLAVADVLNRVRGSFTISGPAQATGIAAVNDRQHLKRAKEHNSKWLPWLSQALKELELDVVPSAGNFVLVRFHSIEQCQDAHKYLRNHGIILRPMAGYNLPEALRITVGTEQQNQICTEALQVFLSQSRNKI
ncbi:MAG: histidinol-phosphate transaminase [Gammaproteobacteria bacterium]|nr:histidinol-phosphate transaminase [Gammaproteobacteria bacterium]